MSLTKEIPQPYTHPSCAKFLRGIREISHTPLSGKLDKIKALGLSSDSGGGYTCPDGFTEGILLISKLNAIVRPRATVLPMTSDSLRIPTLIDSTHAGSPYGGAVLRFLDEGESMAEDNITWGLNRLIAKKLAGYTYASNSLLNDTPALTVILMSIFGRCSGYMEDKAFIAGSGVGEPLGILNSGALIKVNRSASNTIAIADLANMLTRLTPDSHQSPQPHFHRLADGARGTGQGCRASTHLHRRAAAARCAFLRFFCVQGSRRRRRPHFDRFSLLCDRRPASARHGGIG